MGLVVVSVTALCNLTLHNGRAFEQTAFIGSGSVVRWRSLCLGLPISLRLLVLGAPSSDPAAHSPCGLSVRTPVRRLNNYGDHGVNNVRDDDSNRTTPATDLAETQFLSNHKTSITDGQALIRLDQSRRLLDMCAGVVCSFPKRCEVPPPNFFEHLFKTW